jgi:hypothetical protein
MKTSFLRIAAFLAVLTLAGCGRDAPVEEQPEEPVRLGETTDVDVAAWLKLPREELAKLAGEWADTVKSDREAARNSSDAVELLPHLYPPVRVPVFQKAAYSVDWGFSVPPYLHKRDGEVALHLARFGDPEAASKLADPRDATLLARIKSLPGENNYPVEWSRLVGLVLASSQLKLAGGHVDAATRLVLVHRQLLSVLDEKAARGPLGSVLLPAGRRALALAAKAWREPTLKRGELADDIDKALQEWGAVPGPLPGLALGASKETVAGVLGKPVSGKSLVLRKEDEWARAVDLMALPVPTEALEVLAAFLDAKGRLAEIQFTYRSKIEDVYPEPVNLAFHLDELGLAVKDESRGSALFHQTRVGGGMAFEATRTNNSSALGGWVRISSAGDPKAPAASRDFRDFGPASLDRGFEANRVALGAKKAGSAFQVTGVKALSRLTAELHLPAPATAQLLREKDHDLLAGLLLSWGNDENPRALSDLLPPLWSAFGNSKVTAGEDEAGAFLTFTWRDDKTRLGLRLPCDEKGPTLAAQDARGKETLAERAVAARKRDARDRQTRLREGKPAVRLPRSPGEVNDFSLDALRLGQSRAEAEAALPAGVNYRRKAFPGGVSVIVRKEPEKGTPFWARQIILRYDGADRLAEVRLRYQEGLAPARKGETLPEKLSEGAGEPESLPARWAGLWGDLPASRARAAEVRWQDDLTIRTYQRDAGGAEVILTDRAQADAGKPLPPLAFIAPGVAGCRLGADREAVAAALKAPVGKSGGADVHRPRAGSPYGVILVWYRAGKASRIVAVDRAPPPGGENPVAAALGRAWARNLDELGFTRRQEGRRGRVAGSYYWHDDVTRVEAFVQTSDEGAQVVTEWRSWPLLGDGTAAGAK